MNIATYVRGSGHVRSGARSAVALVALFSAGLLVTVAGSAQAAATAVPLGTAGSFVVLAGAGVTNTGPTTLNGDIGTFPTTSITGTSTLTVTGTNHAGNAVTQNAKNDLVTAYNDAAGQGPITPIAGDLGGQTLSRGVYNSASSIGLTGALTLDAAGDPAAVFVFQAGSTLTTASASSVVLINGAQACNVFWQVGTSATLGTGSSFRGSVLALQDITVTTGTTVEGRVLARNGAVTLDTNTITRPTCATPVATASPTATSSPSPTATSSPSPTATPSVEATGGGGTNDQVEQVPSGPVDTGDGGPGAGYGGTPLLAAVVVLAGVGGTALVAALRRRQS